MIRRIKIVFLLLVIIQGLHSIEEYTGQLWEVFPSARFLSGLISSNLERGFIIINVSLFLFGILCWFYCFRKNSHVSPALIWFWIIIELINGIGHPLWALAEKSYTPGLATAPILFFLAIYLASLYHKLPDQPKRKI